MQYVYGLCIFYRFSVPRFVLTRVHYTIIIVDNIGKLLASFFMELLISICHSPCFSPLNSLNNYVSRYMVCNEFLMLIHFLCRYDPCIDDILRDWIVQKMSVKKRVLQKEIKQKALELILPYCPNFQASQRWISSFLHRHGINLTGNVSL